MSTVSTAFRMNGGRWGRGRLFFARVVLATLASFGAVAAATGAAQARDLEEEDDTTSKGRGQLSDAELMYRAMKRSNRDSKDDVAIDRAIARARADSEHRKRALRESMSTWRDPFADPADRANAPANASPRQRQTMRRNEEELRAARSEAARARWDAAAARAEVASARAEAADAKVEAARAEAAAARAQFVASKQTCGVLDPPKPRRPTVAVREPRDDRRSSPAASSGDWMPAMRRASAHSTAPRRLPTSATPRPAPGAPVPAAAPPVAAAPRPAEPPAPPPVPARPAGAPTGIIVVPIPPPPEPERARRRN